MLAIATNRDYCGFSADRPKMVSPPVSVQWKQMKDNGSNNAPYLDSKRLSRNDRIGGEFIMFRIDRPRKSRGFCSESAADNTTQQSTTVCIVTDAGWYSWESLDRATAEEYFSASPRIIVISQHLTGNSLIISTGHLLCLSLTH